MSLPPFTVNIITLEDHCNSLEYYQRNAGKKPERDKSKPRSVDFPLRDYQRIPLEAVDELQMNYDYAYVNTLKRKWYE